MSEGIDFSDYDQEAIDNMNWTEVLGTIAGDNTVFLAVRNENDSAEIAARIQKLISGQ